MNAKKLLNDVPIRTKLFFLAFLVVTALSVPTLLFFSSASKSLQIIESSIAGSEIAVKSVQIAKLMAEHRGLSARFLSGDNNARNALVNKGNELTNSFSRLQSQLEQDSTKALESDLQTIQALWMVLKSNVPQRLIEANASFEEHSLLIRQARQFISSVLRHYNMNYLQSPVSYNLTMSAFIHLPALTDQLGKVRGLGAGMLSAKTSSQLDEALLKSFMLNVEQSMEDFSVNVQTSVETGADLPNIAKLLGNGQRVVQVATIEILNRDLYTYDAGLFFDDATIAIAEFYDFNDLAITQLNQFLNTSQEDLVLQQRISILVIVIVMLLTMLTLYFISRSISVGVTSTVATLNNLAEGKYGEAHGAKRKDEFGAIARTLSNVSTQLDDFSKISVEAIRVKQALDNSSSCFMMADKDLNIIYMNEAVVSLLTAAEHDIKASLPHFSASKLLGQNIDDFHRNPRHQRAILREISTTYTTKIHLGNHVFRLIVNPIYSSNKQPIGHSVEWQDMTEYYEKETRITRLLESLNCTSTNIMIVDNKASIIYTNPSIDKMFKRGESAFKEHVPGFDLDNLKGGSFHQFNVHVGPNVPSIADVSSTLVLDIKIQERSYRITANPINLENGDKIGAVIEWVDRTREVEVEQQIDSLVQAAVRGDFTSRLPVDDKSGFQKALCDGLNDLLDVTESGLKEISRIVLAVSEGDLTQKIDKEFAGTFADISDYCNATSANLADIVGEIRHSSESISVSSSEIALGNADLSHRTEQQASSLEETASSVEQINSAIHQTAETAKEASRLAQQTSSSAAEGGELVQNVVFTMESINTSAQKIEDIIGVIDGIAFQTNILALNAAVEAARAGDQGRGFAVVASEVRTLAQRSAKSAKDIKTLISDSVDRIEKGNDLVIRAGQTMEQIVISIKRVSELMTSIATASSEQAIGIDEVNRAIITMDEMTQQNAALVEEAAAAAESMHSLADQLNNRVKVFDVGNKSSHTRAERSAISKKVFNDEVVDVVPKLPPADEASDDWESF